MKKRQDKIYGKKEQKTDCIRNNEFTLRGIPQIKMQMGMASKNRICNRRQYTGEMRKEKTHKGTFPALRKK